MKGQVELVIVSALIAFILFIPMLYIFGASPKSEIETQVSDIEPYMKTTQITTSIEKIFLESSARRTVFESSKEFYGEIEQLPERSDVLQKISEKTAENYERKISQLESGERCSIETSPDIEVDLRENSQHCGIETVITNSGEPLEVKCSGEKSEITNNIPVGKEMSLEGMRYISILETVSDISEEDFQDKSLEDIEKDYEEKEEDCIQELEVEIGEATEQEVWINVSYPRQSLLSSDGLKEQEINYRYSTE